MQPVHLAIGIVEGFVTAAIVAFVHRARPELLDALPASAGTRQLRTLLLALLAAAAVTGGVLSWFASKDPDGLEWSIARVTGADALPAPEQGVHAALAALQERIAVLPDYAFRKSAEAASIATGDEAGDDQGGRRPGERMADTVRQQLHGPSHSERRTKTGTIREHQCGKAMPACP